MSQIDLNQIQQKSSALAADDFVTTWRTNSINHLIVIATTGAGYNYSVDWGDGSALETGLTDRATHIFTLPGDYSVRISGTFPQIYNGGVIASFAKDLLSVDQWGAQVWRNMNSAFLGCSNLQILATDTPNLSQVTDICLLCSKALLLLISL